MTVCERISYLLDQQGKTQAELARYLGTKQSTVTGWIKLGRTPSSDVIPPISEFLNVSTDYLLGKTEIREPADKLIVPDVLSDVAVGFHRGEFEGLTQSEIDALAVIAKTLKEQRKL